MKKNQVILLALCLVILFFPLSLLVTSTAPVYSSIPMPKGITTHSTFGAIILFFSTNINILQNLDSIIDNIIPTVTIISPFHNETVTGNVLITGTANNNDGHVDHVEVSINRGPWINAVGTTTWTYQWDTTKENNGICKISAQSYDGTDYSNVTSIDVTVDNTPRNTPPVINIIYPREGDIITNITTIRGSAYDSDDDPINIILKIDQGEWEPVAILIAPPYIEWSYQWNTSLVPNGNHTITVQATDGQDYTNASLTVTVSNLNPQINAPPVVNITNPLDGSFVTGIVTLRGTASDIDGDIEKVEIRINEGPWNTAIGTAIWNYNWDTRVHPDNSHVVSARSFDGSNYSNICTITLTIDNTPPQTTPAILGTEGTNNWWTSNITITLTGTDNTSGIKDTYYKLDTTDWEIYTVPITLPDEGAHLLLYYSHDVLGNKETNHSLTLKIDKTTPVTNYTITPNNPTGTNGWYTRRATFAFTRNDSVSWINTTWYRINNGTWENYIAPVILQDDGIHMVEYYSIDNAGNKETLNLVEIKIDKAPPTIRISKPVANRLYIFDREIIRLPFQIRILGQITLEVFANDKASGIQKVQYIIDYGTRVDVTRAPFQYIYDESSLLRHRHVITAKAVDKAGNTTNTDELTIWIFNI